MSERIATPGSLTPERIVKPGSVVEIFIEGDEESVTLVISQTHEPGNPNSISISSPIGRALAGKKEGDDTSFDGPEGTKYRVLVMAVQ